MPYGDQPDERWGGCVDAHALFLGGVAKRVAAQGDDDA
jgi:hypothetical protein